LFFLIHSVFRRYSNINGGADRRRDGYFRIVLHMQYDAVLAFVELLKVGTDFLDVGHRNQLQTADVSTSSLPQTCTYIHACVQAYVYYTSMSVLLIVGPKCTLAASHAAPGASR